MSEAIQIRNAKFNLMSDSRFDAGDVLAIPRGGKRVVVLEVQRPDWPFLQGALNFVRLCEKPPGVPPWPDDVSERDTVIVLGKIADPDIDDKLKAYGVVRRESKRRLDDA